MYKIEQYNMRIYYFFFEVPYECYRILSRRCEKFLNDLNNTESEDTFTDYESQTGLANTEIFKSELFQSNLALNRLAHINQQKKSFKNIPQVFKYTVIFFLGVALILSTFFISEYFLFIDYRSRAFKIVPAFNDIIKVTAHLFAILNAIRQFIEDPNVIMNRMSTFDYLLYSMDEASMFIRNIERMNEKISGILDKSKYQEMKDLLFNDICGKITYFANIEDCRNFSRDLTQRGITALIANFVHTTEVIIKELSDPDNPLLDSQELFEGCSSS